jgi:hypothetical protein
MKVKLLVGLALAIPSFHVLAATDTVRFSGSVQRDSSPATAFDVSIPAGETSKFILADGTSLEFSAAASQGSPGQSVVRLLDPAGKQLHSATTPGNAPMSKSLSYTICGSRVRFVSPAPANPTSCARS